MKRTLKIITAYYRLALDRPPTYVTLFLLIVLLGTVGILWQTRTLVKLDALKSLSETLEFSQKSLHRWKDAKISEVESIASDPKVIQWTRQQLKLPKSKNQLKDSPYQKNLRSHFTSHLHKPFVEGFFVIDKDFKNLVSMRDENIGLRSLIGQQNPQALERCLEGQSLFVPPIWSDVPLSHWGDRLDKNTPTMFALAPIRDSKANVIAILAMRINPFAEFSAIVELGRPGLTGETYLINNAGRLISESRFRSQLVESGLLPPDTPTMLSLEVRDPGVKLLEVGHLAEAPLNWPLTKSAASLKGRKSGSDLNGYRDYRGHLVFGSWIWDKELDIGIIAEMDKSEALAVFHRLAWVIIGIFSIFSTVGLLMAFGVVHLRKKSESRLLAAKLKAENANRMKDKYVALVAHDLKGPLSIIGGFSDLLMEDLKENPKLLDYSERIFDSTHRMVHQIDEILNLERFRLDKLEPEFKLCDIHKIVNDAARAYLYLAQKKKILIDIQIDPKTYVCSDPRLLSEVVSNLISNAIKFSNDHAKITISVEGKENPFLVVADTGIGIEKRKLDSIFDYKSAMSTKGVHGESGTGLGLSLCKELMVALGGDISVQSVANQGSTFRVSLPPLLCHTNTGESCETCPVNQECS